MTGRHCGFAVGIMHIVALSGLSKKASYNTGLLRSPHTMKIIVPGDLPLFNEDLEAPELLPEAVKLFRAKLQKADAFLFSKP
ncbi:hypothetical protein B484DRAFT_399537 [Ochromonadaceae sp. CCMP2298]|nr:hypothetical protein B484DRAFT_399537 [Ochromonadaceae sp. CCMP2298]